MFNTGLIAPKSLLGLEMIPQGGDTPPPAAGDLELDYYKRATGTAIIQDKIDTDLTAAVVGGYEAVFDDSTSKINWAIPLSNSLTAWSVAVRGYNYTASQLNGYLFGGNGYKNIELNYISFVAFRDNLGVHHKWDGTANTISIPTANIKNTKFTIIFFVDGGNIHCVLNGNHMGYITPSTTAFYFDKFMKGYIDDTRGCDGIYSDLRFWNVNIGLHEALKYDNNGITIKATTHLWLNGCNVDSYNGNVSGILTNVTYQLQNLQTLNSVQTAQTQGYIQEDATGLQVIAPQYPTPAGWTAHPGGKIHNLIQSYIDFAPPAAVMAGEAEMVINGGFETGIFTAWYGSGVEGVKNINSINPYSGTYCAELIRTSGSSFSGYKLYQNIITKTGYGYVIGFWAKGDGLDVGYYRIYDVDNSTSYKDYTKLTGSENGWTYFEYSFVANSLNARILITLNDNANLAHVYLDDVSLKEIPQKFNILNRANETTYTQAARDSINYDSERPFLFHIDELASLDTMNSYIQPSYLEKLFIALKPDYCNDPTYVSRLFAYANQKTGATAELVHAYTGQTCRDYTNDAGETYTDDNQLIYANQNTE